MGVVNDFYSTLVKYNSVFLDTAPMIYHLEDIEPYSGLTAEVFTALARGDLEGVISTVSVTELLTKPFREGKHKQITALEAFLLSIPHTQIFAANYAIARHAAMLRGKYGLRTPDALLFSTAQETGCDAFLTNDSHLKKLGIEGISVIILSDFVDL